MLQGPGERENSTRWTDYERTFVSEQHYSKPACNDTTHLECCEHLVSVATPHGDDVANPSCCKQLTAVAEATEAALLQRELSDLLQV